MNQIQKIAIIGGGGRTGSHLVNQLLEKGYLLKLLLRKPEQFQNKNSNIEILQGDVLDTDIIEKLIDTCDAVMSTVGQRKDEPLVASVATRNVLNAIGNSKKRYILLAGLNVDTPFDKKGSETLKATQWMKDAFPAIHKDRQKSYELLAMSEVSWTMVRVPFIDFNAEKSKISINLEDCPGTKISAASIAEFMVQQLTNVTYERKAPFIAA